MDDFQLVQIDPEYGHIYFNTSADLSALLDAAKGLARDYPGSPYAVLWPDGSILWRSDEKQVFALFRAADEIAEGAEVLIAPGADPVALMTMGSNVAAHNPDWTLNVRDSERRIIWTTQKSTPGKAEGTHQNG